jgi:hypothetical protein
MPVSCPEFENNILNNKNKNKIIIIIIIITTTKTAAHNMCIHTNSVHCVTVYLMDL